MSVASDLMQTASGTARHLPIERNSPADENRVGFRWLVEDLPAAVYTCDAAGRVTFFNEAAATLWGRRPVLGEDLWCGSWRIYRPDGSPLPLDQCPMAIALRQGQTEDGKELIIERPDGTRRHVLVHPQPQRGEDGAITGAVNMLLDITESKHAELALRESEERFRSLAMNAPAAIYIKDLEGRYTLANPLACQALGRPDGVQGLSDHDLLPSPIAQQLREHDMHVIATGESVEHEEVVERDGYFGEYLSVKFPLFDAQGRAAGVCGVSTDITDRKRAENARRAIEERFTRFMQHLPGLAWIKDTAGRYVFANEAASKAFQVSLDDLRGKTDEELFPSETARQFRENDLQALASEAGIQTIETLRHADGVVHYSLVNKFPIPDPSGAPALIGGMAIDITDRKQAEEALRESEERFRTLASHAPVGIFMSKAGGQNVFVNEGWCAMAGMTPEQARGDGWIQAVHPEDRDRVVATWQAAAADRASSEDEFRFLRPDGLVTWLQGKAVPLRSPTGEVDGYIGTIVDITQHKLSEAALRESEERFRHLANHAPVMIWVSEADGSCTFLGKSWCDFTGQPLDEGLGFGWIDAVHPDDRPLARDMYLAANARREPFHLEYRLRHRSGEYRWALDAAAPRFGLNDEFLGYIGSVIDITNRKQAEQSLKEADQRKDEFLAILAHELRNPLAPIRTGLELMRLAGEDRELVEDVRAMMDRQAQHMVRLIDDLLDVSRITRGTVELRKCRVDLASVVQSAVEAARPIIDDYAHQLKVSLPKTPIVLEADPTRLAQVIANLLNNASKYMQPNGEIQLTAECRKGQVVVRVKDRGIGIPAEMLEGIFGMFTQLDRSLERSHGGLGIGLTLVKRLIEMHGGTIEAHSEGLGKGSEFVIRLPLVGGPVGDDSPGDGTSPVAPDRRRILVVDDNESAAKVLALLLKTLGNDVRTAHDGLAAIEVGAEFFPDVILLDIGMPKLNGYEAARRIRELPWGKNVVLAALTGWGQQEDKLRTREAGFDHHFVKPVDPAVLQAMLADCPANRG